MTPNRKEILFRKFTVRKYPNHRKYIPHHRHRTMDYFEPHKKLIQAMQKQERKHQELTDKHEKRIAIGHQNKHEESLVLILPVVKLARITKKWASLAAKLKKSLGV